MKQSCFSPAQIILLVAAFVSAPCLSFAGEDARKLVMQGAQSESRVQTGVVSLITIRQPVGLSANNLKKVVKNPQQLQKVLDVASNIPLREKRQSRLVFDNSRNELLEKGTGDGQIGAYKDFFTQKVSEVYEATPHSKFAVKEEVTVNAPRWPPNWPYNLLRGRFWEPRLDAVTRDNRNLTLLSKNPHTGEVVLKFSGGRGHPLDEVIWMNLLQGYSMCHSQTIHPQTGRVYNDTMVTYKLYGKDIWYPAEIIDARYVYDSHGTRYLVRRETTTVAEAHLNEGTPAGEMQFGPIPEGAAVQDNRFQKPLAYRQGAKQFNDRELFAATHDSALLEKTRYAVKAQARSPLIYLVVIGVCLTTASIIMRRRTSRL